jgi:hypothetical protein
MGDPDAVARGMKTEDVIRPLNGRSDVSHVLVRYKVKPEQAARNEALVRRVYEELYETAPAGLRYATFVLEDGVSFVHLASIETEDGRSPLLDVAAFRAFQADIGARCAEPPAPVGLREVGSYGFWGRARRPEGTGA